MRVGMSDFSEMPQMPPTHGDGAAISIESSDNNFYASERRQLNFPGTSNMQEFEIPLSIIATTIALLAFCGEIWRLWRDRPRLIFYVMPVTFTNVPTFGEMKMVRVLICNVGYRPIVLTRFAAFGERSSFSMGIDDEPAATFGKEDRKFPAIIGPGETLKIHPIGIEALERNATKPKEETTFYDPFKYFALNDSFGRWHAIEIEDVRSHLGLSKTIIHPSRWQKIMRWFYKKLFFARAKNRL